MTSRNTVLEIQEYLGKDVRKFPPSSLVRIELSKKRNVKVVIQIYQQNHRHAKRCYTSDFTGPPHPPIGPILPETVLRTSSSSACCGRKEAEWIEEVKVSKNR
jgi:hypothetical protein